MHFGSVRFSLCASLIRCVRFSLCSWRPLRLAPSAPPRVSHRACLSIRAIRLATQPPVSRTTPLMSAARRAAHDTTEDDQASPRTVTGDAGVAEGGYLSASRLLRSVGRLVGLGSPQGVPDATNPSRLHTTLGTVSAAADERTDPSGGEMSAHLTGSVQAPLAPAYDEQAEARRAAEHLARSVNDALAKHEVAEPSVNDAIFNLQTG